MPDIRVVNPILFIRITNNKQVLLPIQVPIFAAYLYDAVNVYARALKEALDEGDNPRNGTAIVERIKGRTYDSEIRLIAVSCCCLSVCLSVTRVIHA